jgi:hypothetical protein
MRIIPKQPTLEEIVAGHGGLEDYLNEPEQMALNNGKNYRDIMLLLDVSVSAAARLTGRNKKTMYKIKAIRDKEAENDED